MNDRLANDVRPCNFQHSHTTLCIRNQVNFNKKHFQLTEKNFNDKIINDNDGFFGGFVID